MKTIFYQIIDAKKKGDLKERRDLAFKVINQIKDFSDLFLELHEAMNNFKNPNKNILQIIENILLEVFDDFEKNLKNKYQKDFENRLEKIRKINKEEQNQKENIDDFLLSNI